jgi:hypothetical protein
VRALHPYLPMRSSSIAPFRALASQSLRASFCVCWPTRSIVPVRAQPLPRSRQHPMPRLLCPWSQIFLFHESLELSRVARRPDVAS